MTERIGWFFANAFITGITYMVGLIALAIATELSFIWALLVAGGITLYKMREGYKERMALINDYLNTTAQDITKKQRDDNEQKIRFNRTFTGLQISGFLYALILLLVIVI